VVVTVSGKDGSTFRVTASVADCDWGLLESITPTVNDAWPLPVGVPEITPLVEPRLSPSGRDPSVMEKLYGAIPPLAATTWE
jgi:hypothetical protein